MKSGVAIKYGDVAPEAKENFVPMASESKFNTLAQLQQYNLNFPNYANPCELYQTVLDGTAEAFPSVPENANLGLISNQLSDENGTFAEPITLTLSTDKLYSSIGLTLTFDTYNDIYANRINVKWIGPTTESIETLADENFYPDTAFYFCNKPVDAYNKIVITFYSINMPYNRLKLRVIDYGYGTFFYGNELRNVNLIQEIDPISTEISINTVDFTLDSKSDIIYSFQTKQPLNVYFNGELKATSFVKTAKRKAKRLWDITSEDYIGLMDSITFFGGVYDNKNVSELLQEIFDVAKIPYHIGDEFANLTISGHIPYSTCREALMQVAFAIQAVVDTSNSEVVKVFALPRNLISNEILGEQAKAISENTVSNIGYVCPVGNEIIFGHTKEIGLEKGKDYTISFKAWSNNNYSVCWDLWTLPNIGDENLLPQKWFDVTSEPTLYEWNFNVNENFMPNASLRFLNVMQDGTINNITSPIYVTDIQIEEGNNRSNWSVSGRAKHIPLNRIMQGQNFVDDDTVTSVEIVAHKYEKTDEYVELYGSKTEDVGIIGEEVFVKFSEPVWDLTLSGGTMIDSSANHAHFKTTSDFLLLSGLKYLHTMETKSKKNPLILATEIENIATIDNATLVSLNNIDNVAEKCYNWFMRNQSTNLSIVESKHVAGGKPITYGNAKYGIDKYGGKTPSTITYDEPVSVGDVINAETEYLGIVSGRLIKQTFNLNSNVVIKEVVLR